MADVMDERHQLFRAKYDAATTDANLIFLGENDAPQHQSYLKGKLDELLKKYGFLSSNSFDVSANSNTRLIKKFVDSCNKFDSKSETNNDFFERLERKIEIENVSFDNYLIILDILLLTHYFLAYEKEKMGEEQYELYKQSSETEGTSQS